MEPVYIVPPLMLAAPVLIVFFVLRYRQRQTQARYQLLMDLASKGVDLPHELLAEPHVRFSERRRALVLISGGLGLMMTLGVIPGSFDNGQSISSLWGLGLLPLMTGLGYLASWWLGRRGGAHD